MANNEVEIPTKEEIAKLPRWAQVYLGIRSAKRVHTLYQYYWRDSSESNFNAIGESISTGESMVFSAGKSHISELAMSGALAAAKAAERAWVVPASHPAYAASFAIKAALEAGNGQSCVANVFQAIKHSVSVPESFSESVRIAVSGDYRNLLHIVQEKGLNDSSSIPPGAIGNIWNFAPPEGWPGESWVDFSADTVLSSDILSDECLILDIELPEDVDEDDLEERIVALIAAASAEHVVAGGSGLVLGGIKVESAVFVPEGSE